MPGAWIARHASLGSVASVIGAPLVVPPRGRMSSPGLNGQLKVYWRTELFGAASRGASFCWANETHAAPPSAKASSSCRTGTRRTGHLASARVYARDLSEPPARRLVRLVLLELVHRAAVVIDHRFLERPNLRRRALERVEIELDVLAPAVLRVRDQAQDAARLSFGRQRVDNPGHRRVRNAELARQRLHRMRTTVEVRIDHFER